MRAPAKYKKLLFQDQCSHRKEMGYYFAKSISYVFHPLLAPVAGLWFVFHTHTYLNFIIPPQLQRALYIVVFIVTFVFPVLSSIALLILGQINSLEMKTVEERRLPYLLTAIYYSLGYYMLTSKVQLPQPISIVLLGANISVVLALLVNIQWKMSVHTVGIGGIAGMLLGFSNLLQVNILTDLIVVLLIAGLIGYARLRLNTHTPAQIYVGFTAGFLCEFLLFLFLG